jgi:hypothetical protein
LGKVDWRGLRTNHSLYLPGLNSRNGGSQIKNSVFLGKELFVQRGFGKGFKGLGIVFKYIYPGLLKTIFVPSQKRLQIIIHPVRNNAPPVVGSIRLEFLTG